MSEIDELEIYLKAQIESLGNQEHEHLIGYTEGLRDTLAKIGKLKAERQPQLVSNCCGDKVLPMSDICSNCLEHCVEVREDEV